MIQDKIEKLKQVIDVRSYNKDSVQLTLAKHLYYSENPFL